jgi:hypothetical protein
MKAVLRSSLAAFALVSAASLVALGCDTGGLLNGEDKTPPTPPEVKGHSATEMVSGGTLAKNNKYKMFYVLGQPSPQQGVAKGESGQRLNGGLTGAVQND